jgi:hypothetical protein
MRNLIIDIYLRCPDIEIVKSIFMTALIFYNNKHASKRMKKTDTKLQNGVKKILSDAPPEGRHETADESTWHQFRPPVCLDSLHGERLNSKTNNE